MSDVNQKSEGHDIVQAGRDILISFADPARLREQFGKIIAKVAEDINRLAPGGFASPRTDDRQFSGMRLIVSMAKSGIPIPVGLDVLEVLRSHLEPHLSGDDPPSTTHLRRAVLAALYALAGSYPQSLIEQCADVYARRWGNPDERLVVIERDGTQSNLDYRFLGERLLPHLIEKVIRVPYENLRAAEIISKTSANKMCEEILDHVKSLNVYGIRYKTLFNLAYDLAVQPPHPWFVTDETAAQTATYDIDRATQHDHVLDELLGRADKGPCRHAVNEAVHHACSAILAHYRAFLGVSILGSLAQLIHALSLASAEGHPLLWQFSSIQKIEGDLRAAGTTKAVFAAELNRLKQNQAAADDKLPVLVRETHRLVALSVRLAAPSSDPLSQLRCEVVDGPSRERVRQAMKEALIRIDGFGFLRDEPASGGFWFTGKSRAPLFRLFAPEVLLLPVFLDDVPEEVRDHLPSTLERVIGMIDDNHLCNTVLLVAHARCDRGRRSEVYRRSRRNDRLLFLLDSDDLSSIVAAKDRTARLLEILHNH